MRNAMKNGEMDAEPENNLGKHDSAEHTAAFTETGENYDNSDADEDEELESASADRPKPDTKKKPKSKDKDKTRKKHKNQADSATKVDKNLTVEGDDFFGSD